MRSSPRVMVLGPALRHGSNLSGCGDLARRSSDRARRPRGADGRVCPQGHPFDSRRSPPCVGRASAADRWKVEEMPLNTCADLCRFRFQATPRAGVTPAEAVSTPRLAEDGRADAGRPWMVWFYWGGTSTGRFPAVYDGSSFAKKGVVLVASSITWPLRLIRYRH